MPFFYKNKNQTETQKNLDKNKTGEINVYTFIFLRKNIRINIYPLIKTLWPGFSFAPVGRMRPIVCASHCRRKPPHKSENSTFQIQLDPLTRFRISEHITLCYS